MTLTYSRAWLALVISGFAAASTAIAAPDLNGGTWRVVNPPQTLMTTAGRLPPLLPAAKKIYEQHLAAAKTGDRSWDGTEKCLAPGLPRLLTIQPGAFEFLQRPEQIVLIYEWDHMVRTIDMNVPHSEVAGPTYLGQSVGHWQGNTLVVDTTGFNDSTLLDSAGLPHSEALHLIERYTPSKDGKTMTVRISVEDPQTFSAPWSAALTLTHDAAGMISEDVCLERNGIKWTTRKEGT